MKDEKPPISDTLSEAEAQRCMDYWGIPDWRSEKGYPKHSPKIQNEVWRWEFLRRDYNYRELWKSYNAGWEVDMPIHALMDYGLYELLDARLPYKDILKKREYIFQQYPAVLDPEGKISWLFPETTEMEDRDIERILNAPNPDRFIDIRLDLTRPLSPQLASAAMKKMLGARQKKLVGRLLRHRVSDDPAQYLRTIDAIFFGATDMTIGSHIFSCTTDSSAATRGSQAREKCRRMWQNF